jgi:DNA recombination protein RmuC
MVATGWFTMLGVLLVLGILNTVLLAFVLVRLLGGGRGSEQMVREELRAAREEQRQAASELRNEVTLNLHRSTETLAQTLDSMGKLQTAQLESMAKSVKEIAESTRRALDGIRDVVDARIKELREGNEQKVGEMRQEVSGGLKAVSEHLRTTLETLGNNQQSHLEGIGRQLKELGDANQAMLERIRTTFDERMKELLENNEKRVAAMRQELSDGLKAVSENVSKTLADLGSVQRTEMDALRRQLKELSEANQGALERIRGTFDQRIKELQEGNERKLEEMRQTVDEKLHDTLEKRLGESFKVVSERLEVVHRGLGEMQNLVNGVGDLKRVLSNVKVRGTWAEIQLGAILEQILVPGQYERNVRVKADSGEAVEYAIRLPGPKKDPSAVVWLPIDSKFPQEDYLRLQEAAERGDAEAVQRATEALARTVRLAAKDIYDKYVDPPHTTDFAIMFLATEGLYAEVLRQPGLVEQLLQDFRIVVAGPTTLAAILSSLRMGFQTLAIEQRAAEVWKVLGAVKTEFGKFGQVLDKVKRQLSTASRTIEETGRRTRAMERRLRAVEELPEEESRVILELEPIEDEVADKS